MMGDEHSSTKTLILGSILAICCPLLAAHAAPAPHPAHGQAANSHTTNARAANTHATGSHATAASHTAATHAATSHMAGIHAASNHATNIHAAHGKVVALRAPTTRIANHGAYRGYTMRATYLVKSGKGAHARLATRGGGISCVPYARNASGIQVAGNAWQWWDNAQGVYARGRTPEPGSVLAFRSNGRMRLGHVAVVSRVVNAREIQIDHANWGGYGGGVAHGVSVVDVSEANNWTAVRVGLAHTNDFGSVYPTYGFIYDRPDTGVMVAHNAVPAPTPAMNPVPSDLRPAAERPWRVYEEVAQAPATLKLPSGQIASQVLALPPSTNK